MRHLLLGCLIIGLMGAACTRLPEHHLDRLRLSDSPAINAALTHTDGYDGRFELARVPYLHAHVDVTYTPGWWTKEIPLTCVLTGPTDQQQQRVARTMELPRGRTQTTWLVIFSGGERVKWAEGQYKLRCATPTSSVDTALSVIDTTALVAQPINRPTIDQLLGKDHKGQAAPAAPAMAADASSTLSKAFDGLFAHMHTGSSVPTLARPSGSAPEPSPAPPAPQLGSALTATVEPHFYSTETDLGEAGVVTDQFNAATAKYVGFEVPLSGVGGEFSLNGCVLTRVLTGVVLLGSSSWSLGQDTLSLRGTYGSDTPGQWLPGQYELACATEGINIARRRFTVYGQPLPKTNLMHLGTKLPVADAKATAIKFIESGYNVPPVDSRQYYTGFGGSPRYIGTEVTIELKASQTPKPFTFGCTYFTADGRTIGYSNFNAEVPSGLTSYHLWVSWGNEQGDFWWTGTFYSECDMNGVFMASRYFTVQRR
jgi:hypothetical protein